MVYSEGAKVIDSIEELQGILDEECQHPTIERLLFIEAKGKDGKDGGLFPCYIVGWMYDDIKPEDDYKKVAFQCHIVQYRGGEFGIVQAIIHDWEIGTNKRFWDKPPKKSLRDETPWVNREAGEQGGGCSVKPEWIFEFLYAEQQEYEAYWVRNIWGFGNKMRDYLLEGKRRIPLKIS